MNKRTEQFLNEVCGSIRCKSIHNEIREELKLHIEELTEEYISQGMTGDEAERRAVAEMGNAGEIGQKLNEQHKPQTEWGIILLTAVIAVFGIMTMYVSSRFERPVSFSSCMIHVGLGAAALTAMYFMDHTRLKKHPFLWFGGGAFLVMCCVCFGINMNGARRTLRIAGMNILTPEIASVMFIIAFCGFLEKYRCKGFMGIGKLIMWAVLSLPLFALMPSLATMLLLFVTYSVLLLRAVVSGHFGGNHKSQLISLLSFGGIFAVLLMIWLFIHHPLLPKRLTAFINFGNSDPLGAGYIYATADKIRQSLNFVGQSNALSNGSIDRIMPGITSEFALLNFASHFGIAALIALILAIAALIVRMFITVSKIRDPFGYYLSLGACMMLTLQFVLNIIMNFGLAPSLNISLPFISYGGTGYITSMIYVGFIISAWRKNRMPLHTERVIDSKAVTSEQA